MVAPDNRISVADLLKYSGSNCHFQGPRFRGSVEYYSQYYCLIDPVYWFLLQLAVLATVIQR